MWTGEPFAAGKSYLAVIFHPHNKVTDGHGDFSVPFSPHPTLNFGITMPVFPFVHKALSRRYLLSCLHLVVWCIIIGVAVFNVRLTVPKSMKKTGVLENKVDRMWVSNTFFEWTCEVIHQRREEAVLLFDNMLNITHCNKPTSLCC